MKPTPFNQKDPSKTKTSGAFPGKPLPTGKTGAFDADNKKGGDNTAAKKAASKRVKK